VPRRGTFSRTGKASGVAAAMLLCALASTAGAASQRLLSLPLHGTLSLTGSHVLCGSGQYKGLTYVDCGIGGANGTPKKGGYVVLMAANGKVSVLDVSGNTIVFNKVAAPLARSSGESTVVTARPGDEVRLTGVPSIDCKVSLVTTTTTIVCFYVNKQGVRPGSFSFGISDTTISTLGWNAARKAKLLHTWSENG
jgi:hypothetical protein